MGHVLVLGDTNADGLTELGIRRLGNRTLILSAPLPAGRVAAATLAVGTVPEIATDRYEVSPAGDTDHDGFGDVWMATYLFRGPFVGDRDEPDVSLLDWNCRTVVGGFDADGDGWTDVAFPNDDQRFELHYGPFDRDIPSARHPDFDPANATLVEPNYRSNPNSVLIRDLNFPGQLVVTAGWGCCIGSYYYGSHVLFFDVSGPRGRYLRHSDAIAGFVYAHTEDEFQLLPDADGDGLTDILYQGMPQTGPFHGLQPEWAETVLRFEDGGAHANALHDVTGDGLGDLVLQEYVPDDFQRWHVVPGTLRGTDPPFDLHEVGVQLEYIDTGIREFLSVDLDGDPYWEVVAWDYQFGLGGEVWIWSGADIQAAYAFLHPEAKESTR